MTPKRTHTIRVTFSKPMTSQQARGRVAHAMLSANAFSDLSRLVWEGTKLPTVDKFVMAKDKK